MAPITTGDTWASLPPHTLSAIAELRTPTPETVRPVTLSHLSSPPGIAVGTSDNVCIADINNDVVERLTAPTTKAVGAVKYHQRT
jgi:hypothetical protein